MTEKNDFSKEAFDNTVPKKTPAKIASERVPALEDLFYIGSTKSEKITVYEDEKEDKKITAVFRTLTPSELRDVYDAVSSFTSISAQVITEKLEKLARAVTAINDMPLILGRDDIDSLKKEIKRDPTPLDQARYILIEKVKSPELIDLLYDAYDEYLADIQKHFDDIKKKLKTQKSSK